MTSMTIWIRRKLALFAADNRGATAVMFGLLAIPLALIALGAIDLSRQGVLRQQMQEALDASALLVARSTAKTDADIDKVGDAAFAEELGAIQVNSPLSTFKSQPENGIEGTATGSLNPLILGMIGIGQLRVEVTTEVKRAQGTPVELVLVLDTTLSMADQPKLNSTPMTDLKAAATKLVNDLHKNAEGANLKIGVVPFGQYVNVGISRRNEPYMDTKADHFVETPAPDPPQCETVTTSTSRTCEKQDYACTRDGRPAICQKDVNCVETTKDIKPKQVCKGKSRRDFNFYGCAGSPAHPQNVSDSDVSRRYPGLLTVRCNSEITLLTANKAPVLAAINALIAKDETYIPAGLAWGFNMLSKAQPLTDAQAYNSTGENRQPRKALVLMTDGANTITIQPATEDMGGYGYRHDKGAGSGINLKQANDYTLELCTNIKAEKIEVFTVAFQVDDGAAKELLQKCATDGEHYFDATNALKLQAAFASIANSLRNLYIAK